MTEIRPHEHGKRPKGDLCGLQAHGLDFKRDVPVSKIGVLFRNHLNIIEPGNVYELWLFDGQWRSFQKKRAQEYSITFKGVPSNCLMVLENHSVGREERIFSNHSGKQIWW